MTGLRSIEDFHPEMNEACQLYALKARRFYIEARVLCV